MSIKEHFETITKEKIEKFYFRLEKILETTIEMLYHRSKSYIQLNKLSFLQNSQIYSNNQLNTLSIPKYYLYLSRNHILKNNLNKKPLDSIKFFNIKNKDQSGKIINSKSNSLLKSINLEDQIIKRLQLIKKKATFSLIKKVQDSLLESQESILDQNGSIQTINISKNFNSEGNRKISIKDSEVLCKSIFKKYFKNEKITIRKKF